MDLIHHITCDTLQQVEFEKGHWLMISSLRRDSHSGPCSPKAPALPLCYLATWDLNMTSHHSSNDFDHFLALLPWWFQLVYSDITITVTIQVPETRGLRSRSHFGWDETGWYWRRLPKFRDRDETTYVWSCCSRKFGKKFGMGRDYSVPLRKFLNGLGMNPKTGPFSSRFSNAHPFKTRLIKPSYWTFLVRFSEAIHKPNIWRQDSRYLNTGRVCVVESKKTSLHLWAAIRVIWNRLQLESKMIIKSAQHNT